jgi:hypothetical protein
VQVNPEISAKNESTNVVVSENDNDNRNDSDNDNRNDADADADAHAGNGNLNLSVGVNDSENGNENGNTNSPVNTDTNSNSTSNSATNNNVNENRNPDPFGASRALCESYGGTFTVVNSGDVLWTCTELPVLEEEPFIARQKALAESCARPFSQSFPPPQDATCFLNI